ncbi:MAG: hypothetical protein K9K30_02585 [Burkholderiaceae bacterium]|nr:hypothetical protein [Burkholderiaceae bacterium]
MPHEEDLPEQPLATLAAFVGIALAAGRSVLILVPDDDPLPELSNALDLSIRPLCLVLPAADFAAQIALRATLSLLKSRLWRDGEEAQSDTWTQQRHHIEAKADLWQEAQSWVANGDRSDAPLAVAELFPVRILPVAAWRKLRLTATDITVLYRCDAPVQLIAAAGGLLRIGMRSDLSQQHAVVLEDVQGRLVMERNQLTRDIADLELELATVQAEVVEFMHQYYARIGSRMAEVDALQARLARSEAERAPADSQAHAAAEKLKQQADQSARESQQYTEATADDAPAFHPSDQIKRLFRKIAQQIHPDRAVDDDDRTWRTRLMSEANRAYRHGDENALHEIAALWAEGRGASAEDGVAGATSTAVPSAPTLRHQVESLRSRLSEIERELHRIFGSRLYELYIAVRQASRQGRDLLAEMEGQLDASLEQLRHRCPVDRG